MKAWKMAEKEVAEAIGGVRRIRINYSESVEDVIHPWYGVEVKYGKQVPKWVENIEDPIVLNNVLVLFRVVSNWGEWREPTTDVCRSKVAFLVDGISQAKSYNMDKDPLLCMKRPRMRGFVAVMLYSDYMEKFMGGGR